MSRHITPAQIADCAVACRRAGLAADEIWLLKRGLVEAAWESMPEETPLEEIQRDCALPIGYRILASYGSRGADPGAADAITIAQKATDELGIQFWWLDHGEWVGRGIRELSPDEDELLARGAAAMLWGRHWALTSRRGRRMAEVAANMSQQGRSTSHRAEAPVMVMDWRRSEPRPRSAEGATREVEWSYSFPQRAHVRHLSDGRVIPVAMGWKLKHLPRIGQRTNRLIR